MGRGSEGLCRPQVRRCEPSVLPEPVWLLPLVWVRLGGGGELCFRSTHGDLQGYSPPLCRAFSYQAWEHPACLSHARRRLGGCWSRSAAPRPPLTATLAPLSGCNRVQPPPPPSVPCCGMTLGSGAGRARRPWQGGFRTHEGSGPNTQTFAELLFPIMWEGLGSGLDLGGEGYALQVQTSAGDEARRRDN